MISIQLVDFFQNDRVYCGIYNYIGFDAEWLSKSMEVALALSKCTLGKHKKCKQEFKNLGIQHPPTPCNESTSAKEKNVV
jgi:hypothetical protein